MLSKNNAVSEYYELVKKGHWWWDSISSNDGGVVNDEQIRQFYQKCWLKIVEDSSGAGLTPEQRGER